MIACPKCKSIGKWINVIQTSLVIHQVRQCDDGKIEQEGYMQHGDVLHVQGRCLKCEHIWKLRKKFHFWTLVDDIMNNNETFLEPEFRNEMENAGWCCNNKSTVCKTIGNLQAFVWFDGLVYIVDITADKRVKQFKSDDLTSAFQLAELILRDGVVY